MTNNTTLAPSKIQVLLHRPPPDQCQSINHEFTIGGCEVCISVDMYPNNKPCRLHIRIFEDRSTIGGLLISVSKLISVAFQNGVPLESLFDEMTGQMFHPYGSTNNPRIRYASSIIDYVFRWLDLEFNGGNCQRGRTPQPGRISGESVLNPTGKLAATT